jgi:hypothetical protein
VRFGGIALADLLFMRRREFSDAMTFAGAAEDY